MTYPYDDDETEDRVIARALDTDNSDEAAMDRATLDEYRKVLAYLPFEEIEPPAALEDRTIEAALARRPAAIPSINRRAKRRATARWVTLGAAVTAAAAVIGFMFVTGNDAKATPGGRVDLAGAGTENVVDPVLATPGVRKAPLMVSNRVVGQAALTPDGDGVLYDLTLAASRPGRAPLGLARDRRASVVPIGQLEPPSADTVHFMVNGDVSAVRACRSRSRTAARRRRPRRPVRSSPAPSSERPAPRSLTTRARSQAARRRLRAAVGKSDSRRVRKRLRRFDRSSAGVPGGPRRSRTRKRVDAAAARAQEALTVLARTLSRRADRATASITKARPRSATQGPNRPAADPKVDQAPSELNGSRLPATALA